MGNACSKSQIHQDFIAEFTKRPIYSLDVRTWWISWWWKNMDQVEPHGAITEITRGWPPKPHRLLRSPPSAASRDSVWKCVHFPTEKMGVKYMVRYIYIYMVYVYIYILSWYIWYIYIYYLGIYDISSWWFFFHPFFKHAMGPLASTTDWLFDAFCAPWQGLQQSSFAQVNPGHLRMQQNRLMMMVKFLMIWFKNSKVINRWWDDGWCSNESECLKKKEKNMLDQSQIFQLDLLRVNSLQVPPGARYQAEFPCLGAVQGC